jgi:3',5'-cyclic-AMP phosphodiesterase
MAELTTVAPDEAVVHDGVEVRRHTGLAPDTEYERDGFAFRTLPAPGERLATFATVNDVHFGETECGIFEGSDVGDVLSVAPDEEPYPEVMNATAVAEITAMDPVAVIAKGDLTTSGTKDEYERFLAVYRGAFGDRLHHVRGNHDAMAGLTQGVDGIPLRIDLPGVRLAVIDTVIPGSDRGRIPADQLAWLDDVAVGAARDGVPLLVFGHHHCWNPAASVRPADYFGINPDDSEALIDLAVRRRATRGYFAGHTHRNRVRRFAPTGDVPFVEVACVKDYPGSWAEYRVYEGGVLQVHRRLSSPGALAWSERCRAMFGGAYPEYALGSIDDRCFTLSGAA